MIRAPLFFTATLLLLAGCGAKAQTVRFATFNASLHRAAPGELIEDLSTPDDPQARAVAKVIQSVRPDVLLLNEFDYDPDGQAAELFRQNYLLNTTDGWGHVPIDYPHVCVAQSNTGIPSGHDLNNDGQVGGPPGSRDYGNDALGYGTFPGQYGFVLFSRYPIDEENIRTFRELLWKDLPGNHIPPGFYTDEELEVLPLSSKNHADIPVKINGRTVHVLASHPTPPAFDGEEDRNGRRNYDEIGFWEMYIPSFGGYPFTLGKDVVKLDFGFPLIAVKVLSTSWPGFIDNAQTQELQVPPFVIMGDLNADPADGGAFQPAPPLGPTRDYEALWEAYPMDVMPWQWAHTSTSGVMGEVTVTLRSAIGQLLGHPRVNGEVVPTSPGGAAAARRRGGANDAHAGDPAADTADFSDETGPGNLRVDYVLPSADLEVVASGVHWPEGGRELETAERASDHRLVWVDVAVE